MPAEDRDQIKALFEEADRAAPDPPILPRLEQPGFDWRRWVVVPAAAVVVLILGTALVLQAIGVDLQFGFAASDAGEEVVPGMDRDDVEMLAELNLACTDLDDRLVDIDPGPASDTEAQVRIEDMAEQLPVFSMAIRMIATSTPDAPRLAALASSAEALATESAAPPDGFIGPSSRYDSLAAALVELGGELDEFGARTCADIP